MSLPPTSVPVAMTLPFSVTVTVPAAAAPPASTVALSLTFLPFLTDFLAFALVEEAALGATLTVTVAALALWAPKASTARIEKESVPEKPLAAV